MLRKLFRFTSIVNLNSFQHKSLEHKINSAFNNSRLLKYYKPNELTIPQLSLMLQKISLNMTQVFEFNTLFRSEEGISFLKEVISKSTSLSAQDKINILEILADTTYGNRIKVSSPDILHELSLGVATELDHLTRPEVFLKAYRTCALLGRANFFFESKVEEVLSSELKVSLEGLLDIIEGSVLTCRPVSYKLFQMALKKIEKLDLGTETVQSLAKAFEVLNKLYYSYSYGKGAVERVKCLIVEKQRNLNIRDIVRIIEGCSIYSEKEILSVSEIAEELISLATSDQILGRTYSGWYPFV